MRPKQFHRESPDLQKSVHALEETFWVKKAFFPAQCQSSEIIEVTQENLEETFFADACYTQLQNISLNIVVADCVPILLYDRKKKIVWAVHAGWRGSSEKILKNTLQALKEKYQSDMQDIFLYIWPSICRDCYEVGEEVAQLFPNSSFQKQEKFFLDLRKENLRQVLECWILRENIEISQECTFELPQTYFSYRREKLKANFVCGIGVK